MTAGNQPQVLVPPLLANRHLRLVTFMGGNHLSLGEAENHFYPMVLLERINGDGGGVKDVENRGRSLDTPQRQPLSIKSPSQALSLLA